LYLHVSQIAYRQREQTEMDKVQNPVMSLGSAVYDFLGWDSVTLGRWQNQPFNDNEAYEFRAPGGESVGYIIGCKDNPAHCLLSGRRLWCRISGSKM